MGLLNWLRNAVGINDAGRESAILNENKLLEWLGIDRSHPEAINETTYYICLKVLSETMGKLPLKLYAEDKAGGRIRAPVDDESDVVLNRPNPAIATILAMLTRGFRGSVFRMGALEGVSKSQGFGQCGPTM